MFQSRPVFLEANCQRILLLFVPQLFYTVILSLKKPLLRKNISLLKNRDTALTFYVLAPKNVPDAKNNSLENHALSKLTASPFFHLIPHFGIS